METAGQRSKRLVMRSWRRGTKEMDLVLGPFADACLGGMSETVVLCYDALLQENDQDLALWVLGRAPAPERFAVLIGDISAFARDRLRKAEKL